MAAGRGRAGLPVRLVIHAALVQLVTHSVRPTISYRAIEIGIDPTLLGAIAIAFSIVPVLCAIPIGRLADRGRVRAILLAGAVFHVLAIAVLLLWSTSVAPLLVGSVLLGLGHVCGIVAEQSAVAQAAPARLDQAFASFTFYGTLGQIAAPLLLVAAGGEGALLDTQAVLTWAGAGAIGIAIVGIALVVRMTNRRLRSPVVTEDIVIGTPEGTTATTSRGRRRRLLSSVAVSMMLLALVDVVAIYLPSWGVETGVAAAGVGVLLTVRAVGMLIGRLFVARFVRWLGRGPLHLWACVAAAIGVAFIALPIGFVAAAAALFASGFATGVGQPVTMSYVAAEAPRDTTSTWLSVRLAGNGAGMLVVPPIAGLTAAVLGVGGVILVTAGGLLAAGVAASAMLGIRPRPEEP